MLCLLVLFNISSLRAQTWPLQKLDVLQTSTLCDRVTALKLSVLQTVVPSARARPLWRTEAYMHHCSLSGTVLKNSQPLLRSLFASLLSSTNSPAFWRCHWVKFRYLEHEYCDTKTGNLITKVSTEWLTGVEYTAWICWAKSWFTFQTQNKEGQHEISLGYTEWHAVWICEGFSPVIFHSIFSDQVEYV